MGLLGHDVAEILILASQSHIEVVSLVLVSSWKESGLMSLLMVLPLIGCHIPGIYLCRHIWSRRDEHLMGCECCIAGLGGCIELRWICLEVDGIWWTGMTCPVAPSSLIVVLKSLSVSLCHYSFSALPWNENLQLLHKSGSDILDRDILDLFSNAWLML